MSLEYDPKEVRDSLTELTQAAYYADEQLFLLNDLPISQKIFEIHNHITELRAMVQKKFEDLNGLKVIKVDIYKAKSSINIILEGVETLTGNNSLVPFVKELEKDFGTKVNFTFKGK